MVTNERPTRIRWRIIALIFFVYVLMFLDRVNISIAAKYIMPEYGLSQVEFGIIFSAFVFAYALVQVPGGWLGDRFGARRVMTWAIVWWSAFTALTALAGELVACSARAEGVDVKMELQSRAQGLDALAATVRRNARRFYGLPVG